MSNHPPEPECPPLAGLRFPGKNRGPRVAGWQPCSSHLRKLTNLHTVEAWGVNSPTGQIDCFPHQLFHCNALSPLVCICCCSSHLSLRHKFGKNCPHWLDLLAFFYLFWEEYIITVCYWYGLPSWSQSPHPMTYVCILLRQKILSLRLCYSIRTIPVQALSSGHALTTIPPI
jgi:hypothetical protein